ncbi:MAG: hypothetical protein ABIW49_11785 [Knoellia sp.]
MSSRTGTGFVGAGLAGVGLVGAGGVCVGFGVGVTDAVGVLTDVVAAVVGTADGGAMGGTVEVSGVDSGEDPGVTGPGAVVGRVPADTDKPSRSPVCPQALSPTASIAAAATAALIRRVLPDMSFPSAVSTSPHGS